MLLVLVSYCLWMIAVVITPAVPAWPHPSPTSRTPRDLKSPNILVDKHWRVKVCDFNLSRFMEEQCVLSSLAATNPRWLAPEILSGQGYTFSSDVYSFGIILCVGIGCRGGVGGCRAVLDIRLIVLSLFVIATHATLHVDALLCLSFP